VSVRHVVLAIAAALVLGLGVVLLFEVRSSPAAPPPSTDVATPDRPDPPPHPTERAARSQIKSDRAGTRSASNIRHLIQHTTPVNEARPVPSMDTPPQDTDPKDRLDGPKLQSVMAEANKAYDRTDFDEARSIAKRVLDQYPDNVRMLRIMVSSHCIEGDGPEAQKSYNLLPDRDRAQMRTRCDRYGVTFTDPLPK
jgi:hypothetical protein